MPKLTKKKQTKIKAKNKKLSTKKINIKKSNNKKTKGAQENKFSLKHTGETKFTIKTKNKNTFYVTTPIYYPNDIPHLGHAYTTIAADILARWNKLKGKEVFFLTGTDEHGKKIETTALKQNKKPKEFIDALIPEFKKAWEILNIKYDRFIRTTDSDHEELVKTILQRVFDKGDIYKGFYEGLYCTACEAYYTEKDACSPQREAPQQSEEASSSARSAEDKSSSTHSKSESSKIYLCPIHQKPLEQLKEESYFFRLSKYQNFLLEVYEKNPNFISPEYRKHEVINRVKEGLKDFSISRTTFDWGIQLPFDKKHICYVWFDALLNYISGIGYLKNKSLFEKFWPADVHLIGKDILWFHAVYWPAILKSAGIEMPNKVFAHGWWTVNSQKMGKSAGNAVKIDTLTNIAGTDAARYFLLRSTPFGQEGDFSPEALIERNNNELANKLGNLVLRATNLAESNGIEKTNNQLIKKLKLSEIKSLIDNYEFDKALQIIFQFIDDCNFYVQENELWKSKDQKKLYEVIDSIKSIAILLYPFMPATCEKIAKSLNFKISNLNQIDVSLNVSEIKKAEILFRKIEDKPKENIQPNSGVKKMAQEKQNNQQNKSTQKIELKHSEPKTESKQLVDFTEFQKLDIRVGTIIEVKPHPNADKLYVLKISLGEQTRQIVAGLRNFYKSEDLLGKQISVIVNLKPAMLRGVESQGMILAAQDDEGKVIIIAPEKKLLDNARVG